MSKMIRILGILAILVILLPSGAPAAAQSTGAVVAGFGSATIDGVRSPGEWDRAGVYAFAAGLPDGSVAPASLQVMNDASNIYLGVQIGRPNLDPLSAVLMILDVNDNGEQDRREDVVLVTPNAGVGTTLVDAVWLSGEGLSLDTMVGGTTDWQGSITNNGLFSFYELARQLRGRDRNDGGTRLRNTVGFVLTVQLCDALRCMNTFVPSNPTSFRDFASIVIAESPGQTTAPSAPFLTSLLPPGLVSPSGPTTVVSTDRDQCRHGGWRGLGFRNQGQCMRAVESHGR